MALRYDKIAMRIIEMVAMFFGVGIFVSVIGSGGAVTTVTGAITSPFTGLFTALGFGIGFVYGFNEAKDEELKPKQ